MNTWKEIALPALQAIRELQGNFEFGVTDKDIARKLDKPLLVVGLQLRALRDDGYIVIDRETPSSENPFGFYWIYLAPRGLRVLGDWPSEDVEELMEALTNALASARTPDDRGKLKKLMVKIAEAVATRGVSEVVENLIKVAM